MRFGESKKKEETKVSGTSGGAGSPAKVVEEHYSAEIPIEYTSQAFSMVRHPDNNGFAFVTVAFNPVTMDAKVVEVKKIGENRDDAEFFFKVRVGEFFANQESKS